MAILSLHHGNHCDGAATLQFQRAEPLTSLIHFVCLYLWSELTELLGVPQILQGVTLWQNSLHPHLLKFWRVPQYIKGTENPLKHKNRRKNLARWFPNLQHVCSTVRITVGRVLLAIHTSPGCDMLRKNTLESTRGGGDMLPGDIEWPDRRARAEIYRSTWPLIVNGCQ